MERQHHAFQMVSLPLAPVLSAGPPAVPGAPVGRRDMAQVMSSIPLAKGAPLPSGAECREVRSRMADWDQIPARYQEAAGACYALGPLNGTFGGSRMNRARGRAVISRLPAYLRG